MKSLELINERIERTLKAEDKLKMELQLCFYKDEANCIKQDLEVLEIIRKKNVDIKLLKLYYHISLKVEDLLDTYNAAIKFDKHKLTLEELLKLKQWLEENENV